MRHILAKAAVFALISSLAHAGQIQVLGGEHEGFTRLVLHLSEAPNWELTEDSDRVSLRLADGPYAFDLSKAFDRIGRHRISGLTARPDGLEIDLACECAISAHSEGAKLLVLDVKEKQSDSAKRQHSFGLSLISVDGLAVSAPIDTIQPKLPHEITHKLPDTFDQPLSASENTQLKEVQQRLIKQLSNAAALGLVELAETPTYGASIKVSEGEVTNAGSAKLNVAAQTGLSAELERETFHNQSTAMSGEVCIPDRDLEISGWVAGSDFSSGIAVLRRSLGGEISALDDQTAMSMARHYLAFGFGVEALSILHEIDATPETDLLRSISFVLEERPNESPIQFQRMASCPGKVGLWAVLAGLAPDASDINFRSVVESFSALPEQLQIHVSPRLSQALLDMGASEEARLILRAAGRQHESPTADYRFVEAQAELHDGNIHRALPSLTASATADAPISPEALVGLIETEIALGRAISIETMELLEGYAQLYREDTVAPKLIKALTSARMSAGQFQEAWQMVNALPTGDKQVHAFEEFVLALLRVGSDLEFLRYGTALKPHSTDFQSSTAIKVAERFLAMGFPDLAASFLIEGGDGSNQQERRLLQAEIAFRKGNLIGAKAELLGLRDERASQLLARIEAAGRAHPAPEYPNSTTADLPVTLARGHEALSGSQELRGRLEELLSVETIDE